MRTILFLLAATLLIHCSDSVKPGGSETNYSTANTNYVKVIFKKNNWNYPVHIDTCDSCFTAEYYEKTIINNKYVFAVKAFNALSEKLEIDSSNVGYRICYANIYKDSGEVFYSIVIEKNKNNYLKEGQDAEGWSYIDSNRILVSSNRAIFRYRSNELKFIGWSN